MKVKFIFLLLLASSFSFDAFLFSAAAPTQTFNADLFAQELVKKGVSAPVALKIAAHLASISSYEVTLEDINMPGINITQSPHFIQKTSYDSIQQIIDQEHINRDVASFIRMMYLTIHRSLLRNVIDVMDQAWQQRLSNLAQERNQ